MPTLEYRGDYGSTQHLNTARTTSLTLQGTAPTGAILVQSAYARIYVDTLARPYTYHFNVSIDDGYSGALDYQFAHTDEVVYVNVPISVTALDPYFPCKTISSITVVDTSGHGDRVRIRGTVRVYVEYVTVGYPSLPSNVRINGTTAINLEAGKTATLTWNAGSAGAYDTFAAYRVRCYNVADGTTTQIGTTRELSMDITAPYTDSKSYYYYVDIICLYNSANSNTYVSIYTFIQLTAPTIHGAGTNPVYNPRPMLLVTLGDGPLEEYLTLVASGWTPSRRGYPGDQIYLRRNSSYTGSASETVNITETDERMRSVQTALAVNYAPPVYTNPEIIAGTTIVKAADITELQTILASIRAAYDMPAYTFTPCIAGETSLTLWQTHIAELQACITEIKNYVNAWDTSSPTYAIILPNMITTGGPSAAVMQQLRQIVTML